MHDAKGNGAMKKKKKTVSCRLDLVSGQESRFDLVGCRNPAERHEPCHAIPLTLLSRRK